MSEPTKSTKRRKARNKPTNTTLVVQNVVITHQTAFKPVATEEQHGQVSERHNL